MSSEATLPPAFVANSVKPVAGLRWFVIWVCQSPMAASGLSVTVLMLTVTLVAPVLFSLDPTAIHSQNVLAAPSARFPFGTDELGRDILARVIAGARVSFVVGGAAAILGALVGVTSGLVAGYYGGVSDALIMRSWDVLLAFPGALLGIAAAAVLGPGSVSVVIAGALLGVPFFSRLVRASTLVEKERDYIVAARSLGADDTWILARHVFPNLLSAILVQASVSVGQAILLEAALSYLGLGIQPPNPSLGTMLQEAQTVLGQAVWYPIFPGLILVALVASLNFLSDGLHALMLARRR